MPTSKKQLTKLNQVKKAKAEEALEAGGCGEQRREEEAQETREKDQVSLPGFPPLFIFLF